MSVYMCKTHRTTMDIEGKIRKISVYLGAGNGSKCQLTLMKEIKEGTFKDCEIVKIKD